MSGTLQCSCVIFPISSHRQQAVDQLNLCMMPIRSGLKANLIKNNMNLKPITMVQEKWFGCTKV